MAGKKKDGPSKKTVEKQKQKFVEDKTFGMKNKNKSKSVQKKIKGIQQQVAGDPRKAKRELDEKEKKKLLKLAEKEREKELKVLFNTLPTKKTEEELKTEEEGETSDAQKNEKELKEEEALSMLAQIEEEMREEEEMSLEEVIDKERAKILDGTPVTLESFKKWKQFKEQQQAKETERLRKLEEASFKKSGHGISGRLLFELDQSVFVDDADADETIERVEMDDDLFLDEDEEEEASQAEVEDTSFNPETWKGDKPPKNLLQEFLNKRKVKSYPNYVSTNVEGGFQCKCVLVHENNKEIAPSKIYQSKKAAENNAALQTLRYLESCEKNNE